MCNRKFGIYLMALACALVMVIGCDLIEEAAITSFKIGDVEGVINEKWMPKTIKLTVPYGNDLASLAPEITFTGKWVNPVSRIMQDFTNSLINPVTYTVIGHDGSFIEYKVTVQLEIGADIDITVSLDDEIVPSAPAATTLYKNGSPSSVKIEAAKGYTCQWFIDGKPQGTNVSITLDSVNLTTGDHFVTLFASKNGIPYSREFIITIIRQFR